MKNELVIDVDSDLIKKIIKKEKSLLNTIRLKPKSIDRYYVDVTKKELKNVSKLSRVRTINELADKYNKDKENLPTKYVYTSLHTYFSMQLLMHLVFNGLIYDGDNIEEAYKRLSSLGANDEYFCMLIKKPK